MLTRIATALILTVAPTVPVLAQSLGDTYRRNTYYQNFRPAPPTRPAGTGQPSTGQPAAAGAPANILGGEYNATYRGSYSNSYSNSYISSYGNTYENAYGNTYGTPPPPGR
jgi:hypothetical protein